MKYTGFENFLYLCTEMSDKNKTIDKRESLEKYK